VVYGEEPLRRDSRAVEGDDGAVVEAGAFAEGGWRCVKCISYLLPCFLKVLQNGNATPGGGALTGCGGEG